MSHKRTHTAGRTREQGDGSRDRTDRRGFLRRTVAVSGAAVSLGVAGCLDGEEAPEAAFPEDIDASVTTESEGEGVIYQYFHTPWTEVEDDLDLLEDAGVDAIWLPQPARGKLDFQHLATEDQEGFYEPEHPHFGHLEPHPPLGYNPSTSGISTVRSAPNRSFSPSWSRHTIAASR